MKKGGHADRWLVSYADFITLLFAFFVVMYALSLQDVAKFKQAVESIKQAFGVTVSGVTVPNRGVVQPSPSPVPTPALKDLELQQVKELMQETLETETGSPGLPDQLEMIQTQQGLILRIAAEDFFGVGEVEPKSDFKPLLNRIGKIVASTHRPIRIEGYTDEQEVAANASDWELSAGRAAWLAKYWIEKFKIDPRRISVAGLSHFHPLIPPSIAQKSDWARGRNRRIEVILVAE